MLAFCYSGGSCSSYEQDCAQGESSGWPGFKHTLLLVMCSLLLCACISHCAACSLLMFLARKTICSWEKGSRQVPQQLAGGNHALPAGSAAEGLFRVQVAHCVCLPSTVPSATSCLRSGLASLLLHTRL